MHRSSLLLLGLLASAVALRADGYLVWSTTYFNTTQRVTAGTTIVPHCQSQNANGVITVTVLKDNVVFSSGMGAAGGAPVYTNATDNIRIRFDATGTDSVGGSPLPIGPTFIKVYVSETEAPTLPSSLSITNVQPSSFTLNFNKSTDNQIVDYYEIRLNSQVYGQVTAGNPPVANSQPNSYSVNFTGVSTATANLLEVRAVDWAGNASDWVSISTPVPDTTGPTQPGTISFSGVSSSGATASWGASSDNVGVTSYQVTLSPGSMQTVAGTSASFSNLGANTTYGVSVVAKDAAGNSSAAQSNNFTTQIVTVPTNLTASNVTGTNFTLTWSPVSDGTVISYYEIEVDGSVASGQSAYGTTLFRSLGGYDVNSTHSVRVRSVNSTGQTSAWSNYVSVTTDVTPVTLGSVTRPTGSGSLVASAGGSLSVDNKGSANYSIPLRIAPGRSGLQPSLALNYSSGAGNGTAGLGWSLSTGFPQAITRGRSILARDSEVRGVTFTASDKFYLDGKRLIYVGGGTGYGTVNSTYRTEVDSFVTVTAFGSTYIERFEVVDKSGVKMTFGTYGSELDGFQRAGSDSNQSAYSYALKRVEDTIGNFVAFTYLALGGGEYVLTQLDYTGGSSISPAARIELAYEARTDQPVTWLAGRYFNHRARLAVVTAKSSGITTAAYGLNYDPAPAGGRSRLTSVAPVLADPVTQALITVPSTQITWQNYNDNLAAGPSIYDNASGDKTIIFGDTDNDGDDEPIITATGGSFGPQAAKQLVDIDGDGRKDVATTIVTVSNSTSASISCSVQLANGGTVVPVTLGNYLLDPDVGPGTGGGTMVLADEGVGAGSRITFADFTGDGRDDVLLHGMDGKIRLLVSNGTSFAAPSTNPLASPYVGGAGTVTWTTTWGGQNFQSWVGSHFYVKPMPCDLNGDGRTDYVCITYNRSVGTTGGVPSSYFSSRFMTGVISKPDGTFSAPFGINTFVPTTTNGDNSTSPVTPQGAVKLRDVNSGAFPGDFNGDGLTDFLCLDNKNILGQRWLLLVNKGEGPDGGATFELHPGVIPNTVTLPGGDTVNTYFTPSLSDGGLGYIRNAPSTFFGVDPQKREFFAAFEGAAGSTNNFLMDINHDGLPDLVWFVARKSDETAAAAASRGWWAMLSSGNYPAIGSSNPVGFTGPVQLSSLNVFDGGNPYGVTGYPNYTSAGLNHGLDYDGDGQSDFFYQPTTNGKPTPSGTVYLTKASTNGTAPAPFGDVVTAVTDGLGRRTDVAYKAAKDDSLYTSGAGTSYPIRELQGSNPVVSDVWHDSGNGVAGDRAQFSYQYSGNRLDLSGRGSLGFHAFVTLDRQTNLFKYQFLAQSFPMTGLTHRDETYRWLAANSFNIISSHDNTVVFDKVSTGGGATLWPFISKAIEYRWENGAGPLSTGGSNVSSDPENLFTLAKPYTAAHIAITATSVFDNQTTPKLTLPEVSGYNPSDLNGSANAVSGTTTFSTFSGLPGAITYGNLNQLSTDFGGGFTETVTTTYKSPVGALTGLVDTVSTSVASPGYGTETAPVKSYNYWNSTPLVTRETVTASDSKLSYYTEYARDTRGRVTNTTISGYNSSGDPQHIGTYTVSTATAFDDRWDAPTTTQNNYGHTTTTVYHPFLGGPTSVTDVNGAQVTTVYDALGRTKTVTDVLKNLTTDNVYTLDATQTVTPPGGLGAVTLTSAYRVTTTATVQATVTTYFDRLGRAIRSIKDGFNTQQVVTDTAYNKLGQVVATSLPYPSGGTKYWTTSTYDALGRVATVTAPNGTVTTNTYVGRATKVSVNAANLGGVDPAAQVNTTLVDFKGRTVKVWNADNVPSFSDNVGSTSTAASISFALDGFGRMRATTLKDQSQQITATYDALGRQLTLNDPDKGNWSYLNNALGQVVTQTDAAGNTTASTFDKLGRPLSRTTTGNGATETANFYYYDTSTVTTADRHTVAKGLKGWIGAPEREEADTTGAPGFDAPATVNLHYYDEKGRPALELAQTDGKWFYTATGYDDYSRPQNVRHYWKTAGDGTAAAQPYVWQDFGYAYAYDSKSYLLSLADSLGRSWWDTPAYDYLDRVTSVKKGNGYTTTRTYRAEDGVLTGLSTPGIQNMTFGFDGLGNLTSRSDTAVSEGYGYDHLNRLKTRNGGDIAAYQSNGNITSKTEVGGTTVTIGLYDPVRPHAVKEYTFNGQTLAITYDGNGNMLTRSGGGTTWSLKWAGFDKPRWMAKGSIGSEFHYNAGRSRVMQLEFDTMASGAPEHYNRKRTYALGSTLELNYNNTVTSGTGQTWSLDTVRIYVPGPDGIIGAREFRPALATPEKALVYHHDHLGSITAITDWGSTSGYSIASGNKSGRYSEDAWGQRRDPLDWTGAPTAATDDGGPDSLTPRGFTGHEMLDDLGLVHMNGRIYDPLIGRMLSADLVVQAPGNLQAYNRYSYVMNNPVTYTDPTGFFWDPNSGVWGASEWGIFGKAAVVDPAVEGYKSGSLNMEKGMTEIANANGALDVTIGVLQIVTGVSEGVGIVADYAPGAKQVKGTANVLAKNVDEIAEGASKLTKMLASKTDDAAGGAAKAGKNLDDVAVDAKKVEVDAQKPATHPLDPEAKPYADVTGKTYEKGSPDKVVTDHIDSRAAGGHPTDPANLDPKSWEANSRKAGFEGNLAKDRQAMIDAGMDEADVDKALAGEKKWIMNDAHPVPVDPEKLKKLQQQ